MKVLFVTSECVPFIKTGGLADVAGSLPQSLKKQGVDVRVVLPNYKDIPESYKSQMTDVLNFELHMGWKSHYCGIKTLNYDGIDYYFIDNLALFGRDGLYGYWDDAERFGFFSMAAIEMMERIDFIPNVIHVHDWHTAMIPLLLTTKYHWIDKYRDIRKVLTIHNLRFQGIFNPVVLESVFGIGYDSFHPAGTKYYDSVNFLQAGINYADRVTTVSPSYAVEIQTPEFGETLDGILRYNSWKIRGILNGIDNDIYNAKTDPKIVENFGIRSLDKKTLNKLELQKELGLKVDPDIPLISSVSRLTDQKGFNLIAQALPNLLSREVQYVILGSGEQNYEHIFGDVAHRVPEKMAAVIGFDPLLAQRIYASSDMFLMPSAFEPCGLSQLISLRYGTIPIVHETGGLRDTIEPYNVFTRKGTGFSFYDFSADTMMRIIDEALELYKDKIEWQKLVRRAMRKDFSWENSVGSYMEVFEELLNE